MIRSGPPHLRHAETTRNAQAPSSRVLRAGIAGYGVVGKRRRAVIDHHPNMKTVAICDRTFANEPFHGDIASYTDYVDLLKNDLDVLFVCLSNDMAARVTIAGLERGLHVFCEKPPGRNVAEVESVIACEKRHPDLKLKYGFNHRYHDSVQDALKIIETGEMGRVMNMRGVYGKSRFISYGQHSDWRIERNIAGGGILLDQGIHMLDLMRLFGGEFRQVYSHVSNAFWKHEVEDNAYALMKSDVGVIAMLHSTATQWRHRFSLEITLERGGLNLGGILSGSKSYGAETLTLVWPAEDDQGDPHEETTRYNFDASWERETTEFATAAISGTAIVNGTSLDALRSMQLVYKIYCSDPIWRDQWGLQD